MKLSLHRILNWLNPMHCCCKRNNGEKHNWLDPMHNCCKRCGGEKQS